nr:MAG TPA: hypothetical protein [Caudoviricetes sp.]
MIPNGNSKNGRNKRIWTYYFSNFVLFRTHYEGLKFLYNLMLRNN